jgi:hypothetical protein
MIIEATARKRKLLCRGKDESLCIPSLTLRCSERPGDGTGHRCNEPDYEMALLNSLQGMSRLMLS